VGSAGSAAAPARRKDDDDGEVVYDETGRLLFTKEMKEEYTLLMPQMLPVPFSMMQRCLNLNGYHVEMLTTNHGGFVDEGLKYVHNDTCYPALLVIGQLIDAIKHGGYDVHRSGCSSPRPAAAAAPPTISICCQSAEKAGLEFIPVVSVNLSGWRKTRLPADAASDPPVHDLHDLRRPHRTDCEPVPPL
jgi:hypothetical protein